MGGYTGTKEEINRKQREYYVKHKQKIIEKNIMYRLKHPEKYRETRRTRYLNNREKEIKDATERELEKRGAKGFGCCVICFESNPFLLEEHHIFENTNFTITLCSNHHTLIQISTKRRTPSILTFFCESD